MAVPLTERNLGVCTGCIACLRGNRCRLFKNGNTVQFKMAQPQTDEYWKGYYAAKRIALLGKRREWSRQNKCKAWASQQFNHQLQEPKPTVCSRCGKGGRIVAHHPDYTDPFRVEWLCNGCHLKEHRSK